MHDETYPTFTMFERFCIPTKGELLEKISEKFSGLNVETFFENIGTTKKLILASVLFSFIAAYLFSFFLEYCAALIVFVTLIGFYVGMGILSFFLWKTWRVHKTAFDKNDKDDTAKRNMNLYKILFYSSIGFICLTLCILLCFFNRLLMAIMVIKVKKFFIFFFLNFF